MARISGRKGVLYVGIASDTVAASEVAYLKKWSLSFSTDNYDVTAFGDDNKVSVVGLPDASGSYDGFYDTATAQLYTAASDGLARKCYIYPDRSTSSTYFFGTAFFDMNIDTPVDGAVSISGDFQAASVFTKVG